MVLKMAFQSATSSHTRKAVRMAGDAIHGVWFDEEPPYGGLWRGLTRTNKYGQFSILTFTADGDV